MSLNESIVEDAALEWFGEQTRYARTLTPALSHGEREEDGEVVGAGGALARGHPAAEPGHSRRGTGNRQGILVSSKHIERRLNP
jgi:hypothetical protein